MKVEWLLDCEPRAVQIEATRRSYYGVYGHSNKDEEIHEVKFRNGPARGWAHYLEMRLGKTPTIYNESELFLRDYGINKLVVLTPNSYKEDWVHEASKFGVTRPAILFELPKVKKVAEELKKATEGFVLPVNYEAFSYDHGVEFLWDIVDNKTLLAFDESIRIKNHDSNFSKKAMALSKEAGVVRLASGLPFTQGPQDLYPQMRSIGQFNGKNFFSFRNRYCKMGGFKGKKVVGAQNEEELSDILKTCSFVAKRKDWGKITVPEYYTIKIGMDKEQARHYKNVNDDFYTMFEDGREVAPTQVISKMLKLQQISSGFVYDEDGSTNWFMDPEKVPKYIRLRDLLDNEVPGKVIIPFHYGATGDMLLDLLRDFNPAAIRGAQWMKKNGRDAQEEKKRFNTSRDCRVILANTQAVKYGHDLSGVEGNRCCYMVFYENTFSLDDRGQVEMRNTSASQDWTNIYLDFVSSPVEAQAVKALEQKMDVVESIIGVYNPNRVRNVKG